MSLGTQRIEVFVSYSHKDTIWLEELRPHLGSLAREKGFLSSFWDDTKIRAGEKWQDEITNAVHSAKVAILLISKHFLDSDFITTEELPPLLVAAKAERAVILPIILSPCRFAHHPQLSKFQSVNPPSEPLEGMTKVQYESVFLEVTELVDEALAASDEQFAGSERLAVSAPDRSPPMLERTASAGGCLTSGRDENWAKVVVQSLPDGSLQYQTLEEHFRRECTLAASQIPLINLLAAKMLSSTSFEPEDASALFELLVPNDMKSRLFHTEGTELILDPTTAAYPWELLQEGAGTNVLPFSLRYPVLRRTISELSAPRHGPARHEALVIGDPCVDSPFAQLPGARYEAEKIANLLRNSGFVVECQIGKTALEALAALFSQRYQLLHFSGHGVYDYQSSGAEYSVSGIVFGGDVVITGDVLAQMAVPPEIAFINAPYLGRHVGGRAAAPQESEFSGLTRFARSFPDQFIAYGSRAVIAPAGPVDDAAADTFATTFYEAMLAGSSLGEAVLTARRKTYERHTQTNTWGMYSCYGYPGYRLRGQQLITGEE